METEKLAEKIWHVIYPDRRKWDKLGQSARDEWIRFTEISQEIILTDYLEVSKILDEYSEKIKFLDAMEFYEPKNENN